MVRRPQRSARVPYTRLFRSAMTDHEDENEALLTPNEVISLQRRIEAGVLARAARLAGTGPAGATAGELRPIESEGEPARQRGRESTPLNSRPRRYLVSRPLL